jgi:putative redox protein
MTVKAKVTFKQKVRFEGWAGSDHTVVFDGPPEAGGEGAGFRPMDLMLLGLGGCMAFDVLMILRRMRHEVTDYFVNIEAERATDPPRVYTQVKMEHVIQGNSLTDSAVQRAIDLAQSTYCSASAMFAKTANIINTYRIVQG